MESVNKAVIINCGVGNWYGHGSRRLAKSLNFVGWAGETLIWADEYPPESFKHEYIPYYMKIAAFEEAIKKEFTHILWVDSSFWAVKNPMPLFDLISDKGVVGFRTGYNMAETSSDAALQWAGITRDDAEKLPEIASGMVGIRIDNPDGKRVYETWKEGMMIGLSKNSRTKDPNDSTDPRFRHARQDQTLFSLAIHKYGLNIDDYDYATYYGSGYDEKKCIFFIGGI